MRLQSFLLLLLPVSAIPLPTAVDSLVHNREGAGVAAQQYREDYLHLHEKRAGESSKKSSIFKGFFGGKKGDKKDKDKKKKDKDDGKKGESSKSPAAPPRISHDHMTEETIGNGLRQMEYAFQEGRIPYAVIGGIAIMKLGDTQRKTADFDILVANGWNKKAVQALLASHSTGIGVLEQSGNDQVWYTQDGKSHNVDIMQPMKIGGVDLNPEGKDTMVVNGARILRPDLLLNLKCYSWMARDPSKTDKKKQDKDDIRYLMEYMTKSGLHVSPVAVPNANAAFFTAWLQSNSDTIETWRQWGFPV